MRPIEQNVRWLVSDWDDILPEMAQLRDVVFLHRLLLCPSHGFRARNPSLPKLWFTSHAQPRFTFKDADGQ